MKRWILFVTLGLALGWGLFWAWSAYSLKAEVAGWFEDRRADGWQAEYDDLTVRGFPNRLDVTLTGIRLHDPEQDTGWQAPFFQVLGLTYKPGHRILVWPETQQVTLPQGPLQIDSTGLRASVIHTADGTVLRANLEAQTLRIEGTGKPRALSDLSIGLQQVPGLPDNYRLGFQANPGTAPAPAQDPAIQLQAEIRFDQPWTINAPSEQRPQPRLIDLQKAAYQADKLQLDLTGQLSVDKRGRGDGTLTLRAENWRELLKQAQDSGQLPADIAKPLENGLTLVTGLQGNATRLDLPLRFERGKVSLGIIPLGKAPKLSLP
ncbi:DUF2125 domain-containing protein [Antarctobacter jejuensis]|uniref:DUF2125 domain-containing protein n=1 Tax=Antarctobacter jejuensis TaxID=1439938 RepID=UPI003FD2A797